MNSKFECHKLEFSMQSHQWQLLFFINDTFSNERPVQEMLAYLAIFEP